MNIDNDQLRSLLDAGTPIVDVRTSDEWRETGVISDSHLLTFFDGLGRFDAEAWYAQFEKVAGPETPVILICHSGTRSKVIGFWLSQSLEYHTVYNVSRGIVDWRKNGGSTVAP
ncbi:MAG: rhodanese-like domain-containing protein [Pseudomonadota bacterium]